MVSDAQYRQRRLGSTGEVKIHKLKMVLNDSDSVPFLQTRKGDRLHNRKQDESSEGT